MLCKDNKTYLSQQGLLYDLERNFRERFACHGYLTQLLNRTGDAGSSVSDIITALKEFDSLAENMYDDSLLQEGIAAAPDFAKNFLKLLSNQLVQGHDNRGKDYGASF